MGIFLFIVFILGYTLITVEHFIKIDKLIPSLLMMVICWTIISLNLGSITNWLDISTSKIIPLNSWELSEKSKLLQETLLHHFGKTSEILIFLMGAMVIVEIIEHFDGFSAIKRAIKTKRKVIILWVIAVLTFFLSAIIDNLTATIVVITITRKLIPNSQDRMWYAGLIIIAANSGGAWSPIGDVTTTMLWIAGKISSVKVMSLLIFPSLVSMLVPLTIASFLPAFKGVITAAEETQPARKNATLILVVGLLLIVFVPLFKAITHLPPYIGMMFSLAIFATIAEIISLRSFNLTYGRDENEAPNSPTLKAIKQIEMTSILFFLGILMTVAALESVGMIYNFGRSVNASLPQEVFILLLGISSAIFDNVPLVAASISMFSDSPDNVVWHLIAYAAGTGGSLLIIGSAAGVVAMGMEKIPFGWYLKKIGPLALLGYLAGLGVLLLIK